MGRGQPPARAISMSERQYKLLEQAERKKCISRQLHSRIQIILRASKGRSNKALARDLGLQLNTVKKWRQRWESHYDALLVYEQGPENEGVKDRVLLLRMLATLSDLPRSGTPKQITLEQENQLVALACKKPGDYGLEMTSWTHQMLAKVAVSERIFQKISARYVGTILKKKP